MWTRIVSGVALLGLAAMLVGCETHAQTGAATGAVLGGATGAIIGKGKGAAIGAGAGALGGYLIGNEQDKAQARQEANTYVVNVRNSNGSITPVALRRAGNVWVGPRGEQYYSLPTEDQLRPMYGF